MTRRNALKSTACLAAVAVTAPTVFADATPAATPAGSAGSGPFTLPPLPYPADALEPHIDARTMEIHHGRHHAGYVANLNKAIAEAPASARESLSRENVEVLLRNLDSVPESVRTAVRNNGGGHYNHSLFWRMMKKGGGGEPRGELARAIEQRFRNFNAFKEEFAKAASGRFGSGWAWLTMNGNQLNVESTANQDNPVSQRGNVLLGLDVWEHAYYLKYQNRRADYITAFWNVVDWDFVAERFRAR